MQYRPTMEILVFAIPISGRMHPDEGMDFPGSRLVGSQ